MWLFVTIFAYFLNALAITFDKFLLSKDIPRPSAYTFNIGLLNIGIILVLAPFGFSWLGAKLIFWSILAGLFFISALFLLYTALKHSEASRIIPFIGSLNPLFIFILAFFFLGERLGSKELLAFVLILTGGALISYQKRIHKHLFPNLIPRKITAWLWRAGEMSRVKILSLAVLSAFCFALSYIITKYVYNSTDFLNGFIWTRFGLVLGALLLLLPPSSRQEIFTTEKKSSKKGNSLFLVGQSLGGLSFFLVNYAFSLHSVTLVQGLQGLQYAFLFLIVLVLSKKFPYILEEDLTPWVIAQKTLALLLIISGLYFLVV